MLYQFDVEPAVVVMHVYNLSSPQGMGFLHYEPEDMTIEQAKEIVEKIGDRGYINLDYVKGRACKFFFKIIDGKVVFDMDSWYDHSKYQFDTLIECLRNAEKEGEANAV